MLTALTPEQIRPEMITLRRKKIKENQGDKSEYEDCPDEDFKSIPKDNEMRTDGYIRAM
jgi:hypothetical protein